MPEATQTAPVDHLLIETQGPWGGPMSGRFLQDAATLARRGDRVWVFLVQDAVATAVPGAAAPLRELARLGVHLWVDDFSRAQRALPSDGLDPVVTIVDMATVVERLLAGATRVVWH